MRRVVVVGASLAGLRAAEALRARGFAGELTIVGEEPHPPYDRPPLSKQLLAETVEPLHRPLHRRPELAARWRLGERAVGLDPSADRVWLDGGEALDFDALVIATGCGARAWPGPVPAAGVHVLRNLDDALALRAAAAAARRVAIVGAGFVGCEVAAALRGAGVEVTLIDVAPQPMSTLGPRLGEVCARLHERHGVQLRLAGGVAELEGEQRLRAIRLTDGERIEADLALVALGAVPHVEWLLGSGLTLADGVVVDACCFADRERRIVAVGDAAVFPHPLAGGEHVAVRHWSNAVEQAAAAAANLLAPDAAALRPYEPVPSFWSDQYEVKIQSVGLPERGERLELVDGSLEQLRFVMHAYRDERLVGAIGFNSARRLAECRRDLAAALRAGQVAATPATQTRRSVAS